MLHALDLDEIRKLIGVFLGPAEVAVCCLVSRDWHASFRPLLWAHVELKDTRQLPPTDQLQAHSTLIRTLRYAGKIPAEYFLLTNCRRLVSLGVLSPSSSNWDQNCLVELIQHAPALARLELFYLRGQTIERNVYHAISSSRTLTTLWLNGVSFSHSDVAALIQTCAQRIVALRLEQINMPSQRYFLGEGAGMAVPPMFRIQDLHFQGMRGMGAQDQFQWMRLCPNLKSFFWRGCWLPRLNYVFPVQEFNTALHARTWPDLKTLDVSGGEFVDEQLATLITGQSRFHFEHLSIPRTGFGPLSLHALVQSELYLSTTILELYACENVSSPMIQLMLTMMPALRYFSAGILRVEDMVQVSPCVSISTFTSDAGNTSFPAAATTITSTNTTTLVTRPWACHHLRTLKLCLDMNVDANPRTSEFDLVQRHVFRQIAVLSELETLELSRHFLADTGQASLPQPKIRQLEYRLSAGLGHWTSLRRLCILLFRPGQTMGIRDVDWMIQAWPQLKFVSKYLNTDYDINYPLTRRLTQAGITCV
ncbi:MAG: hypothetical protein J3Q66DRAFT_332484 [Benniella sp.]|nr:MAG: hypothetical protein J3Q66DRAFT_332484 [Benniella sp.]